jgi:hypothetical protein
MKHEGFRQAWNPRESLLGVEHITITALIHVSAFLLDIWGRNFMTFVKTHPVILVF